MINAYEIGVKITMASNAAMVLGLMQREMFGLNANVKWLEGGLSRVKVAALGAMGVIAGGAALAGIAKIVEASKELNAELERTKQLGGDFASTVGESRKRAFDVSAQTGTMTPSELIRLNREVGQTLGDPRKAMEMLPDAAKAAYVASHYTGEKQEDIVKNLMRVADARGQVFSLGADGKEHVDAGKLQRELNAAVKALVLGGGFLKSSDLLQNVRQEGPAAKQQSPEAYYASNVETSIMMGAAKAGTATMGLFQQFVGGTMTKKVAEHLTEAGFLGSQDWHSGKSGGVVVDPHVAKRFTDLIKDPQQYFSSGPGAEKIKAFSAKEGISPMMAVFELFGRQTVQRLISDFQTNAPQFERARKIFGDIPDVDKQFQELKSKDLETNTLALGNAWHGFMQSLGDAGVPAAISVLHTATDAINFLTRATEAHPGAAKILIEVSAGVAALIAISGGMAVFGAACGPLATGILALTRVGSIQTLGPALTGAAGGLSALSVGLVAVTAAIGAWAFAYARIQSAVADLMTPEEQKKALDPYQANPEAERRIREKLQNQQFNAQNSTWEKRAAFLRAVPLHYSGLNAASPPGSMPSGAPANSNNAPQKVTMTGIVNFDGKPLGKFAANAAGNAISGPKTGPNSDISASPDYAYNGMMGP